MLTKKTKYAINALRVLGQSPENASMVTADIAEKARVPKKFLELILLELKSAGIVSSRRGKEGGYLLRKQPSEIELAEILRLFDGPIGLVPCVTHKYYEPCDECEDEVTCGLRQIMIEAREQTVALLKNKTLQTIIDEEKKLKLK